MIRLRRFKQWFRWKVLGFDGFLCDTCKYDYGSVCTLPQRPNAKICDDYRKS
jgi:hypothetical protein